MHPWWVLLGEELGTRMEGNLWQGDAFMACRLPHGGDNPSALGLPPKGKVSPAPSLSGNQVASSSLVSQAGHRSVLFLTLYLTFIGQKGECKAKHLWRRLRLCLWFSGVQENSGMVAVLKTHRACPSWLQIQSYRLVNSAEVENNEGHGVGQRIQSYGVSVPQHKLS